MTKRKTYIQPTIDVVEIEMESLMQTVSSEQGQAGTGSGPVGDETPDLARKYRGTWGDLWN